MKKRNINIDLIKCIAVFSVISVHFFLNTNFYNTPVVGNKMYIAVFFRTLFMICVPLFIITTGYLMKNKELNKKYYVKIFRVIIIYLLSGLLYFGYNILYNGDSLNIKHIIRCILSIDFGYNWYIEMYVGLFILIPFLNVLYNNLKNKKQKKILILTLLILTSFQGILNAKYIIFPSWWSLIYPLTYYFIGCYLREYKINLKKVVNVFLFFIAVLVSSLINIYLSFENDFVWGVHNSWGSIFNVLSSTLIFIFIINLDLSKIPIRLNRIISKISELSLGIYLTSAIVDNFLYNHYFDNINFLSVMNYFKIVSFVFLLSTGLSMIINVLYKIIDKYFIQKVIKCFCKT